MRGRAGVLCPCPFVNLSGVGSWVRGLKIPTEQRLDEAQIPALENSASADKLTASNVGSEAGRVWEGAPGSCRD